MVTDSRQWVTENERKVRILRWKNRPANAATRRSAHAGNVCWFASNSLTVNGPDPQGTAVSP